MGLTGGQKFCVWMGILAALAIIAGSAAPFWVTLGQSGVKVSGGPWMHCEKISSSQSCGTYKFASYSFSDYPEFFYVFHAAEGLTTLLCLVLVVLSLSKVCGESDSAKSVGAVGLLAALLGVTAAVVFYLETTDSLAFIAASEDDLDWAFYLFASGTGLLLIFSIVLLALPNANANRVDAMKY